MCYDEVIRDVLCANDNPKVHAISVYLQNVLASSHVYV